MSKVQDFNDRLAERITAKVGTMWAAYAFACIALVGLPAVLGVNLVPSRFGQIVLWVSSEFLQLVLLAVIMVGQSIASAKTEARDNETHATVMETHTEAHAKLDSHSLILDDQNAVLAAIHQAVTKASPTDREVTP
jgi:hypothetical protein